MQASESCVTAACQPNDKCLTKGPLAGSFSSAAVYSIFHVLDNAHAAREKRTDRTGGERSYVERNANRRVDEHYSLLVAAVEAGDAEEGFRVAHTLKGVAGNLSFSSYFAVLDPVTESLRSGDLESARRLMPNVEKAHMETIAILEQLS